MEQAEAAAIASPAGNGDDLQFKKPMARARTSTSSGGSSHPSKSVWQQKGETLSLNSVLACYNLTEKQLIQSGIQCRWRSYYGNSFPVFIRADVEKLCEWSQLDFDIKEASDKLSRKQKELEEVAAKLPTLTADVGYLSKQLEGLKENNEQHGQPVEKTKRRPSRANAQNVENVLSDKQEELEMALARVSALTPEVADLSKRLEELKQQQQPQQPQEVDVPDKQGQQEQKCEAAEVEDGPDTKKTKLASPE